MTVYCSKCGTPNDEGSRFCRKCGAAIGAATSVPASPAEPYASPPPVYSTGNPKRGNTGLIIAVVVIAALMIAAGVFIGVTALMSGGGNADAGYYEIGGERIPSVSYALGETRKSQGLTQNYANGLETLSLDYNATAGQSDMRAYSDYLQRRDGFAMRTEGAAFGEKSGSGIQLWRNAEADGYMIIVQLDYDEKGYTVTVMRGEGQVGGSITASAPPQATQPPVTGEPTDAPEITDAPNVVLLPTNPPVTADEPYVNTTVGFSIMPREGWYAEETNSGSQPVVVVTTPKNDTLVIMAMAGYTMADLAADEEGFCQSTVESMGLNGYKIDRSEKIKFAGYDCHLTGFTAESNGTPSYYIYNYAFDGGSGKLYVISYVLPPTATNADNLELLDVFATFKIQ